MAWRKLTTCRWEGGQGAVATAPSHCSCHLGRAQAKGGGAHRALGCLHLQRRAAAAKEVQHVLQGSRLELAGAQRLAATACSGCRIAAALCWLQGTPLPRRGTLPRRLALLHWGRLRPQLLQLRLHGQQLRPQGLVFRLRGCCSPLGAGRSLLSAGLGLRQLLAHSVRISQCAAGQHLCLLCALLHQAQPRQQRSQVSRGQGPLASGRAGMNGLAGCAGCLRQAIR